MPLRTLPALALGLALLAPAAADVRESAIHAAFVLNFARYVEWPAGALSPERVLDVCFLSAAEPVGREIAAFKDRPVQGQRVEVHRGVRVADLGECDVVYLGEQDEYRLQEALRALTGQPVLTVGSLKGFAPAGGMIGLYREADRVRFEVNLDAVNRNGLRLSAQLLKLARIVHSGDTP